MKQPCHRMVGRRATKPAVAQVLFRLAPGFKPGGGILGIRESYMLPRLRGKTPLHTNDIL
jgi:hypothetical protein